METATLSMLKELAKQVNKYGNVRKLYGQLTGCLDLWIEAYSNRGSMTFGITKDTVDGTGIEEMKKIMNALKYERFYPKPVKRVYIKKKNSDKKRPLGLPTYSDKLIQEVMRMQLQAVYEPLFLDCSHGFRPNRSCHTALDYIQQKFNGTRWWIEGDIRGCFDNINHDILRELVNKRVDDNRFLKLIRKLLKAGYMENWEYYKTFSGTPQGGILSPLLANIYLHRLDKFMMILAEEFKTKQKKNSEYRRLYRRCRYRRKKMTKAKNVEQRKKLKVEVKQLQEELKNVPVRLPRKKINYCRYADDFIVGIIGNKTDAKIIRDKIASFLSTQLDLELSMRKTKITHNQENPEFLGYELGIIPLKDNRRQARGKVYLKMPEDRKRKFIRYFTEKGKSIHLPQLMNVDDIEIFDYYNYRLRGWYEYWKLAYNVHNEMNEVYWYATGSLLKTLINKYKSSMQKVVNKYYDKDRKEYRVEYRDRNGKKKYRRLYKSFRQQKVLRKDFQVDSKLNIYYFPSGIEAKERIQAGKCELCGRKVRKKTLIPHHIRRMADVRNKKSDWEVLMHSIRRKSIYICKHCHDNIHYNWSG